MRGITFLLILLLGHVAMAQLPEGLGRPDREMPNGRSDSMRKPNGAKSDPASARFADLSMGLDSFATWDSTLPYMHRYNLAQASGQPYVDLGHYAAPQRSLVLQPGAAPGLQSGFNPYPFQNKSPDNFTFYRAKVPFTRFNYQQGGSGFIALEALHTQNISKNWNITLDYRSVNNTEYYIGSGQNHLHRGTALGSAYSSKNGRFKQFVVFTWNRARRLENGGLKNDSLLYDDAAIDTTEGLGINTRGVYKPRLTTAKSFYANRHHLVENRYNFSKKGLYAYHRMDWTRTAYRYQDFRLDTGFYGTQNYRSSDSLNDSSVWNGLSNRLGLGHSWKRGKTNGMARVWYSYEWMGYGARYFLSGKDEYVSQGAHLEMLQQGKQWNLALLASSYLAGYNEGDYRFLLKGNWQVSGNLKLFGQLQQQQYAPGLFQQRFFSNQFRLYNNWNPVKMQTLEAGAQYRGKRLLAEMAYTVGNTDGMIYNHGDAIFRQAAKFTYSQLRGRLKVQLGKLYTDHTVYLQSYSDQKVWSAPRFSTLSTVYVQGYMFKKAMLARFGADVAWQTDYAAWAYRPDMAVFYVRDAGRRAGNYPVADVFFTGEIKTVMITMKMGHINNYLVNYGVSNAFQSAQGYAIEPQRFVLGLVWRFHY